MFTWTYVRRNGQQDLWQVPLAVPLPLVQYYRSLPRTRNYAAYVLDPNDEPFFFGWLTPLVRRALQVRYSLLEVAELLLNFVATFSYYSEWGEYPRYPVEMIVDGGGDCEDAAILTAKLWRLTGFQSALLLCPGAQHMAVGIQVLGNMDGARVGEYYSAEPTWAGMANGMKRIGEVNPDMVGKTVHPIPIPPHPTPILRA